MKELENPINGSMKLVKYEMSWKTSLQNIKSKKKDKKSQKNRKKRDLVPIRKQIKDNSNPEEQAFPKKKRKRKVIRPFLLRVQTKK